MESVDLHGFSLNKKSSTAAKENEDFEALSSSATASMPRPPLPAAILREKPGLKKSASTTALRDALKDAGNEEAAPQSTEEVLQAAKGILMKERKEADEEDQEKQRKRRPPRAREAEEGEKETVKLRPLKKTPSIQALYQSQEIETEFKMMLPPKAEEGPTKVVLQLPGFE